MRRIVFALCAVALFCIHIAGVGAQQRRLFTTGTPAELATARALGVDYLAATARERGVAPADLVVSRVHVDAQSMAHTRVQQRFRGVPVFGGEAIAHMQADGELFAETDSLVANVSVDTTPAFAGARAIQIATDDYGCSDCLTAAPSADLWILRRGDADHLVYRVQMRRLDGTARTAMPVVFVDAHSGDVVWRYDNLQGATGVSLYSGTVNIDTTFHATGNVWSTENLSRRFGTFDLRNGTSGIFDFVDADNVWNSASQRAAVDVQFATERYLTYLSSVFGRNGIDGFGGPFTVESYDLTTPLFSSLVHYGVNYANAFWNGSLMVYGDGDGIDSGPLVSLDIAGHEMTHGVTQYTAGLIYNSESGALNESWSDVFGAMTERFVKGESANTWKLGEDAATPGIAGDAFRYMDNPHLDANLGFTADDDPDHYSERYTGTADNGGVHVNSGIANKAFYLLAKGGAHHRGGSMAGIGADAASRIWYRALTSYMTSNSNFAGARAATLNAAAALYGGASTQYIAVASAWCLVGVGACGVPTADVVSPSSGSGTSQSFTLQYSDSFAGANLQQGWVWFAPNASSPSGNSCMAYYDRSTGLLSLLNDAGSAWTSAAIGGPITLQNSQCAIDVGLSTAFTGTTSLTLGLAITFKPAFGGSKHTFMYASNATGANSGWQDRGTWTVTVPVPTVTADSVSPSSGNTATPVFTVQYSDSLGAADLATAWIWFTPSVAGSAANSCMAYYDRAANRLSLLNDAGSAWTSATMGSATTLQNTQCSLATGGSSAVTAGNTLTLTLPMTLKPAFAGVKNVFVYAAGSGGGNSGWQDRGDWTVPDGGPVPIVTADSVTPNAGTGTTQTFALHYGDTAGATDLTTTWVWFTPTMASAASSCMTYYDRPGNTVFLLNDAGSAWMSGTPGAAATLQNTQCAIALATTTVVPAGNTLTVNLAVTFKAPFAGAKNIFMYAAGSGGRNSGWQDRGDWTVTSAALPVVTANSATPATGSGSSQTFALQYGDTAGATDLATTWVWFTPSMAASSANSCMAYYQRSINTLFLLNDAGTAWTSGVVGTAATIQNNQCAIALGTSGAVPSGNTLTVSLAVSFKPAFAGAKNVFMFATNGAQNSGWQDNGDWTVPAVGMPVVTTVSMTPNTGAGATQAFALQYADTAGATDLTQTWVWFTPLFTSPASSSCMAYYQRATNQIFLLNDAGTAWASATVGAASTLQNSQCAISLGASSAVLSGTSLTLNLAMTFKSPAFSGARNVFMFATNGTQNSGWQDRGDWTVP